MKTPIERVAEAIANRRAVIMVGSGLSVVASASATCASYEQARPLYQRVGSVLGEANCNQRLGDVARARSDHEVARGLYEQALKLYERISDPYSIGGTLQRLARMGDATRFESVRRAEAAWRSIDRSDLLAEPRDEFPDCFTSL